MWREAAEPRERWRGPAPAEGDKGTRLARHTFEPGTELGLPAPTCLNRYANTKAGFSVFQKLDSWSGARARVPLKGLAGRTTLGEEEF